MHVSACLHAIIYFLYELAGPFIRFLVKTRVINPIIKCCIPASVTNDVLNKCLNLLCVEVFLCDKAVDPLMVRVQFKLEEN